jgi:hypothetical protein
VLALAACAPLPANDSLAVRYEVRVGQSVLPNVRSVAVTGPDLELTEVSVPGVGSRLIPGRLGAIKLVLTTDWASAERTIETWRLTLANPTVDDPVRLTPQNITIAVTSPSGGGPATYTFLRCLPSEHQMRLGAQDARIEQVWRVSCEGFRRS